MAPVRPGDHHRRVPPDERADPPLDVLVAGEPRLALGRDGVDVGRRHDRRDAHALRAGLLHEPAQQVRRARLPRASTTDCNDSSHSRVSAGSMSGSWCTKSSMNTTPSWVLPAAPGGRGPGSAAFPLSVRAVPGVTGRASGAFTRTQPSGRGGPGRRTSPAGIRASERDPLGVERLLGDEVDRRTRQERVDLPRRCGAGPRASRRGAAWGRGGARRRARATAPGPGG